MFLLEKVPGIFCYFFFQANELSLEYDFDF